MSRGLSLRTIRSAVIFCLAFVVLTSSLPVRKLLSSPLIMHDLGARGDACYVLAGGGSIWERLDAAADLIQMKRVSLIILMEDNKRGPFSFKANSSWPRTKWMTDYLNWRGIPSDRIRWIPKAEGRFGTLVEARAVTKVLPKEMKTLVIVSSAPHMRRATLAFRRSLPADVQVVPYAATNFDSSYELHHPIWIEYLKLLIYYLVS